VAAQAAGTVRIKPRIRGVRAWQRGVSARRTDLSCPFRSVSGRFSVRQMTVALEGGGCGGENGAHHRPGDRHLGQLEGHGAGADLDQLQLQAGQRPVGHFFGQLKAAQESGQVGGQRVELVVAEPFAGQPRPAQGVLPSLMCCSAGPR